MPVYEYICSKCSEDFSVLKLSSREKEPVCPSCGSKEVSKKISAFSCFTASETGSFTGGG